MKAFFISVALITVSVASVSAQQLPLPTVELTEPELVAERSPDYEPRKIGAAILGFGLALAIPSATLAGLAASNRRNQALLGTHAAITAVGTSLVIGGIIRLVRTSRNALVDRRRLRRRLIPLVILAALSHAVVTVMSVLPTTNLATGYNP